MGYGVDEGTMNGDYFDIIPASQVEKSAWNKEILSLKSVCWMDPKAYIYEIPASWRWVAVVCYHGTKPGYHMCDSKLEIQSRTMDGQGDWQEMKTTIFPPLESKILDATHGEIIEDVMGPPIQRDPAYGNKSWAMKIRIVGTGGWKKNWNYEGFGIVDMTEVMAAQGM